MIYRRKTYKVLPEHVETFNNFFRDYLLPNQLKNGARLVGRFVTEQRDEIVAIWEYASREEYEIIQERVRRDDLHLKAQARRKQLGTFFLEAREDFLEATGQYQPPKQIVAVNECITHAAGERLERLADGQEG